MKEEKGKTHSTSEKFDLTRVDRKVNENFPAD